jgi:hypothetical protein
VTTTTTAAAAGAPKSSTLHFALTIVTDSMPKCFLQTSRLGSPYWGVLVSFCFGLLAFLSISSGSDQAFTWLSNLSGGCRACLDWDSHFACAMSLVSAPLLPIKYLHLLYFVPRPMSHTHAHPPAGLLTQPLRPTRRAPVSRDPRSRIPWPVFRDLSPPLCHVSVSSVSLSLLQPLPALRTDSPLLLVPHDHRLTHTPPRTSPQQPHRVDHHLSMLRPFPTRSAPAGHRPPQPPPPELVPALHGLHLHRVLLRHPALQRLHSVHTLL